jgi:hypothetical protein
VSYLDLEGVNRRIRKIILEIDHHSRGGIWREKAERESEGASGRGEANEMNEYPPYFSETTKGNLVITKKEWKAKRGEQKTRKQKQKQSKKHLSFRCVQGARCRCK